MVQALVIFILQADAGNCILGVMETLFSKNDSDNKQQSSKKQEVKKPVVKPGPASKKKKVLSEPEVQTKRTVKVKIREIIY